MKIDKEIRLYELLGVNIFRKKVLFAWEKFAKFFHLDVGYRLDSYKTEDFKEYIGRTKAFAIAHVITFILSELFICTPTTSLGGHLFIFLLNGYCILTQRYNYLRIKKILDRKQKRDERIAKEEEEKEKEKEEEIVHDNTRRLAINELRNLRNDVISSTNSEIIEQTQTKEYIKVD